MKELLMDMASLEKSRLLTGQNTKQTRRPCRSLLNKHKTPGCFRIRGFTISAYRYLEVETFTPGPMVETTVQERIY